MTFCKPGKLLVASPRVTTDIFDRGVIFVIEHDAAGAWGVLLGTGTTVDASDVVPAWSPYVPEPGTVNYGGPVGKEAAIGLVVVGGDAMQTPRGIDMITDKVGTADLNAESAPVGADIAVRVFAGYAGWSAGQLEQELLLGVWHVVDSHPEDIMATDVDVWDAVLRRQRSPLAWLATKPVDPGQN